jgi:hypothetical protein
MQHAQLPVAIVGVGHIGAGWPTPTGRITVADVSSCLPSHG